jgi:hypothetical protein
VNGSPGIGKSVFGIYFLYCLVKGKVTDSIVYSRDGFGTFLAVRMDDENWKCVEYVGSDKRLKTRARIVNPYVIVDRKIEPGQEFDKIPMSHCEARSVIVISSPKTKLKEFGKQVVSYEERYLSLWEDTEFSAYMKACYNWDISPDFSDIWRQGAVEAMRQLRITKEMKRTDVFGFHPRSVCSNPDEALYDLPEALSDQNLSLIFCCASGLIPGNWDLDSSVFYLADNVKDERIPYI